MSLSGLSTGGSGAGAGSGSGAGAPPPELGVVDVDGGMVTVRGTVGCGAVAVRGAVVVPGSVVEVVAAGSSSVPQPAPSSVRATSGASASRRRAIASARRRAAGDCSAGSR